MPDEKIEAELSVKFPGGVTTSEKQSIPVEAYDKVEAKLASLPKGGLPVKVEVQPGEKEHVKFCAYAPTNTRSCLTASEMCRRMLRNA